MPDSRKSIVFGVFKGMGDLLSAAPVILEELRNSRSVHLLLFPNATLWEFCGLIDFAPYQTRLFVHTTPEGMSGSSWRNFLSEMRHISPQAIWISPHAPTADSSWKIPLILRIIQIVFWKKAQLVGAESERLSWLFHRRLLVDRGLPLRQREWSAYRLFRGPSVPEQIPRVQFVPAIANLHKELPLYDLVIHPGATAANRVWPHRFYAPLITSLPIEWRIALVGLPQDLASIQLTMPNDRPVDYISGSIRKSIQTLASASVLLVMDSGNMHFAQVLGIPAVAVFGYHDPATVIDLQSGVVAIYDPKFPCQPCDKEVCSQPKVYCMDGIEPEVVADRLRQHRSLLAKDKAAESSNCLLPILDLRSE